MAATNDQTSWRIGFDIGGTFTDFILEDRAGGTVRLHKRLTSAYDPAELALIGLDELTKAAGIGLGDVGEIVHGTTLVTNAIIERRGAKLGLITTEGFRDILEMGTEQRYDIYDLFLGFPEPLVPRHRRLEVRERLDRNGSVVAALDEAQVRAVVDQLVSEGVAAIAVCFLHAYANDRARAARRRDRARTPSAVVGLAVVRRRRRAWRIPALRDDLRQCLCAAVDGALSSNGSSAICGRAVFAAIFA